MDVREDERHSDVWRSEEVKERKKGRIEKV